MDLKEKPRMTEDDFRAMYNDPSDEDIKKYGLDTKTMVKQMPLVIAFVLAIAAVAQAIDYLRS